MLVIRDGTVTQVSGALVCDAGWEDTGSIIVLLVSSKFLLDIRSKFCLLFLFKIILQSLFVSVI